MQSPLAWGILRQVHSHVFGNSVTRELHQTPGTGPALLASAWEGVPAAVASWPPPPRPSRQGATQVEGGDWRRFQSLRFPRLDHRQRPGLAYSRRACGLNQQHPGAHQAEGRSFPLWGAGTAVLPQVACQPARLWPCSLPTVHLTKASLNSGLRLVGTVGGEVWWEPRACLHTQPLPWGCEHGSQGALPAGHAASHISGLVCLAGAVLPMSGSQCCCGRLCACPVASPGLGMPAPPWEP